ncbi:MULTISPECIES: hypothetical protein [unclassified Duganella]|uniref:IS66 family insertion sequence element accessory protein TnpA n=1 Tax=unclassified Duganella TaxID=2636909 RepID=UPI0006FE4264|nr:MULTISPECIES: hypothetical protein [unclassified Duganella]KQV59512.1 hypothetical protein ASD07_25205 [Duganella sp. Root336D2]
MSNTERELLWRERVARWHKSGMSQRAFALAEGYPVRQVGYWVRRLSIEAPKASVMPVVVKQAPVAPALLVRGPQGWSIELPAGTPAGWVAELMRSL